jgi:hypothetical protein
MNSRILLLIGFAILACGADSESSCVYFSSGLKPIAKRSLRDSGRVLLTRRAGVLKLGL